MRPHCLLRKVAGPSGTAQLVDPELVKPAINFVNLETPVAADSKAWYVAALKEPIDGRSVHFQVLRYLLNGH